MVSGDLARSAAVVWFVAAGCTRTTPPDAAPAGVVESSPPLVAPVVEHAPSPASAQTTVPAESDPKQVATEPPPRFRKPIVPRENSRTVVLQYHEIGKGLAPTVVDPSAFEEHMDWLGREGIDVIKLSELLAFVDGELDLPARAAVITFDDGQASARRVAYPLLAKRGYPFTLAVSSGFIEMNNPLLVSWDDIREMVASGLCEVASHGHRHANLARVETPTAWFELAESRRLIGDRMGLIPATFVYPFGASNLEVDLLTQKAGYSAAFTAWAGAAKHDSPRYRIPRVGMARGLTMGEIAHLWVD